VATGVTAALLGYASSIAVVVAGLPRLPPPLTSAEPAGVLLPFCLAPASALAPLPLQVGAVCLAWLLALRLAPSYAATVALGALLAVVLLTGEPLLPAGRDGLPRPGLDVPVLTVEAVTAVALPLCLVTMGAQHPVGLAVLGAARAGRRPAGAGGAAPPLTCPLPPARPAPASVAQPPSPALRARRAASARSSTSSLVSTLETWLRTVLSDRNSSRAIRRLS
jgi:benzoate membrane transport protein